MWKASTPDQKKKWAELMQSSVATLSQYANGHGNPSNTWAELFSLKLADGSTKETLFPDNFSKAA